ncbi:MAG TPA: hypothetical protein VGL46_10360 [Pseudonocardiaceae bacterium]
MHIEDVVGELIDALAECHGLQRRCSRLTAWGPMMCAARMVRGMRLGGELWIGAAVLEAGE